MVAPKAQPKHWKEVPNETPVRVSSVENTFCTTSMQPQKGQTLPLGHAYAVPPHRRADKRADLGRNMLILYMIEMVARYIGHLLDSQWLHMVVVITKTPQNTLAAPTLVSCHITICKTHRSSLKCCLYGRSTSMTMRKAI